jgi:hypothetical protein
MTIENALKSRQLGSTSCSRKPSKLTDRILCFSTKVNEALF